MTAYPAKPYRKPTLSHVNFDAVWCNRKRLHCSCRFRITCMNMFVLSVGLNHNSVTLHLVACLFDLFSKKHLRFRFRRIHRVLNLFSVRMCTYELVLQRSTHQSGKHLWRSNFRAGMLVSFQKRTAYLLIDAAEIRLSADESVSEVHQGHGRCSWSKSPRRAIHGLAVQQLAKFRFHYTGDTELEYFRYWFSFQRSER